MKFQIKTTDAGGEVSLGDVHDLPDPGGYLIRHTQVVAEWLERETRSPVYPEFLGDGKWRVRGLVFEIVEAT